MAKNNKPQTANPLAGMGLDEIVRSMTNDSPSAQDEQTVEALEENKVSETGDVKATPKRRRGSIKTLEENIWPKGDCPWQADAAA